MYKPRDVFIVSMVLATLILLFLLVFKNKNSKPSAECPVKTSLPAGGEDGYSQCWPFVYNGSFALESGGKYLSIKDRKFTMIPLPGPNDSAAFRFDNVGMLQGCFKYSESDKYYSCGPVVYDSASAGLFRFNCGEKQDAANPPGLQLIMVSAADMSDLSKARVSIPRLRLWLAVDGEGVPAFVDDVSKATVFTRKQYSWDQERTMN